ncbi:MULTISPECIES: OmpP1/FadL family transporter [Butyricimonas]|uniref:OmpP1/FadL family transporter n=1 Tax=Butyricimonas TaxID=574697 RepID=UPI001D095B56|nr:MULTISPECIES: outer membrane protein transport protein [Butyricimonas]MCB6972577.1 outer membrane protein transport protein [Butyricimonas synergistica]MCG4519586.1 outer membrane protein transport protein [Butyricimonas sp. DFI.6.44]
MKKLVVLVMTCMLSLSVFAEGYQVNLLSTKQTGMGHVGVGMKLGAESMHFNPAGLVFLKTNMDFSLGISAVMAKAKYSNAGYSAKTDNPVSTPLYAYAGFKIYDNLAAGISLTTPYGSSLKWPKHWEGASLIQDISLKSYVIQPTLSYKITDKLSIGVGLQLAWGNVNLSRGLMGAKDFQGIGTALENYLPLLAGLPLTDAEKQGLQDMVTLMKSTTVPPAYARLEGNAHMRVGFNVGIMYDVCDKVTVGLSYRSKIKMRVKEGDAELTYSNRNIENMFGQMELLLAKYGSYLPANFPNLSIPKYDQGSFHAELPLPSNTTLGVSYRPTDRWELALDLQYVGWSAYDSLNVYFNEAELGIAPIKAEKNYKNAMTYRIGASYKATERLDVRAGVYFDQSPIRKNLYNPETPGMNKLGISAGLTFEPYKNLQIDVAFLYIQGFDRDGKYPYKNVVTGQDESFGGKYKSTAFTPSIGLAYRF